MLVRTDRWTDARRDVQTDIHTNVRYVEVTFFQSKFVHETGFFPKNTRIFVFCKINKVFFLTRTPHVHTYVHIHVHIKVHLDYQIQ